MFQKCHVCGILPWKYIKRQNSTHLTLLKHQNTKTSLYKLFKNHWVITLLGIFGFVRRNLQSTVSLDHPVLTGGLRTIFIYNHRTVIDWAFIGYFMSSYLQNCINFLKKCELFLVGQVPRALFFFLFAVFQVVLVCKMYFWISWSFNIQFNSGFRKLKVIVDWPLLIEARQRKSWSINDQKSRHQGKWYL